MFSVPRISEDGYIFLSGLHQLGTDDACVGDEQRNHTISSAIVRPDWLVTLKGNKITCKSVYLTSDSEPTNSPALIAQ